MTNSKTKFTNTRKGATSQKPTLLAWASILFMFSAFLTVLFLYFQDDIYMYQAVENCKSHHYGSCYASLHSYETSEKLNAKAMYYLGYMHLNALGGITKKDATKAWYWLNKAAKQKDIEAQYLLGYIKYLGIGGIEKSTATALKWFSIAALRGHPSAQFYVGWLHYKGEVTGMANLQEAANWWQKAATQNHRRALYYLGDLYVYGKDIEQDVLKGVDYLKKSAELGYQPAYETLENLSELAQYRYEEIRLTQTGKQNSKKVIAAGGLQANFAQETNVVDNDKHLLVENNLKKTNDLTTNFISRTKPPVAKPKPLKVSSSKQQTNKTILDTLPIKNNNKQDYSTRVELDDKSKFNYENDDEILISF